MCPPVGTRLPPTNAAVAFEPLPPCFVELRRACDAEPGNYKAHYQLWQCLKRRDKAAEARVVGDRMNQLEQQLKRLRQIIICACRPFGA